MKDLHEGVESRYKWAIPERDAVLSEREREQRRSLEGWLQVQIRAATVAAGETKSSVRDRLLKEIIKDRAATFLSRMVVVRQLEALGLTETKLLTGGWSSPAYKSFRQFVPAASQLEGEGFPLLCQMVFDDLSSQLPDLFRRSELEGLLPVSAAMWREVVDTLDAKDLSTEDQAGLWHDDTLLGWTYQYWNDPDREALDSKIKDGGKIENHEIAAKTQLFTDRYIVEWLLQNALGQLWLSICKAQGWEPEVVSSGALKRLEERRAEFRGLRDRGEVSLEQLMPLESELEQRWKYWVPRELPVDAEKYAPATLSELRMLDPACGSGHFLVIAFDLLVPLYEEEARHRKVIWSQDQIARWILENNLHGLDIDRRAVRIAHAALWLKVRRSIPGPAEGCPNLVSTDFRLRPFEPDDAEVQDFFKDEVVPSATLRKMLISFRDAEYYGTLVPSDALLEELDGCLRESTSADDRDATERFADYLGTFVEAYSCDDPMEMRQCGDGLRKTKDYLKLINRDKKYHLVVGNPPYQNRGKLADGKALERHCPEGKMDLYSAFLHRALELTKDGGMSALLTLRGWMFLGSFSELRQELLKNYELTLLGDLDRGAFEDILDEVVSVAVSCFRKVKPTPGMKSVAQLPTPRENTDRDGRRTSRKIAALVAGVGRHEFAPEQLSVIPDQPLVYWWDKEFLKTYTLSEKLGESAPARFGANTGYNARFLLRPWEILGSQLFAEPCASNQLTVLDRLRFVPFIAGAGGKVWFEPLDHVVRWASKGLELQTFGYTSKGVALRNPSYYFRTGIAFVMIGATFSGRLHRYRSVMGDMGSSVFPLDTANTLCVMNSLKARAVLSSLNPTVHFQVGDVNRLPLFPIESADDIVAQLDIAFTQHEQARETSVEFIRPGVSAWQYAQGWAQAAVDRAVGEPLPPYAPVFASPSAGDLFSYALGLALGRFLPPNLIPAQPHKDGAPVSAIAQGQDLPDALSHGILFLGEAADSLDQPACSKLRQAWEEAPLAKGTLRDYLKTKFFTDDHLKRYEKRPIYFPLSSANRAFVAYVSIHRWTENTLEHLLADHVQPELHRLGGELNDLAEARHNGGVKAQGQAQVRYDQVTKLLNELEEFAATVRHIAERGAPSTDGKCPPREVDAPFAMVLDDGVMINSAALWPLLEPQWKEPKKWWRELAEAKGKKDYDWAQTAGRYWPSRVAGKCQTDPSLAVAHRCFWKYHPSRAYEWELRLQAPAELGPNFRLDEPGSDALRRQFELSNPEFAAQLRELEVKRRSKNPKKGELDSTAAKPEPVTRPKARPPVKSPRGPQLITEETA